MSERSTVKRLPIETRVALHGELLSHQILPSCTNCIEGELKKEHLNDGLNTEVQYAYCHKYKGVPPLSVVMVGCAAWDAEIPF